MDNEDYGMLSRYAKSQKASVGAVIRQLVQGLRSTKSSANRNEKYSKLLKLSTQCSKKFESEVSPDVMKLQIQSSYLKDRVLI